MHTPDITDENIEKIAVLFPNCVTEIQKNGGLVRAIDFDQLRQELSKSPIVEGIQERYHLNWPGKHEALVLANTPTSKTLRPCREESVDFDNTKNLFIEGDNLDALKLLQETYLNKIKMIYIDPPYNTGNDFIYKDDFSESKVKYSQRTHQLDDDGNRMVLNSESSGRFHSDWLKMMYPRLKLARNLLRDDGVIFISIDDGESDNVRKLCDEVFGEDNFLAQIVWQKIHSTKNDAKYYSDTHEYLVCYSKNRDKVSIRLLPRTEKMDGRFKNPDNDPRGLWSSGDLVANEVRSSGHFEVKGPTGKIFNVPSDKHWVYSQENLKRLIEEGRIWFGKNGDAFPRLKRYLSDVQQGRKADTLWLSNEVGHNQESKREVKALFDGKVFFDTPKPVRLLKRCAELTLTKDDIALDFFAGSATTAHAVMALNAEDGGKRRYIMVQMPELCNEKSEAYRTGYKTIADIAKERIRRSGKKIQEDNIGKKGIEALDVGFRVLKIAESNMKSIYYTPDEVTQNNLVSQIDHIRDDRTPDDLLFQVLLDLGVDLTLLITQKKICGKTVFFVDPENSNALVACFDKQITEELVTNLTQYKPAKAVFRDAGFESDSLKINVEQIFKHLSPETEIKVL